MVEINKDLLVRFASACLIETQERMKLVTYKGIDLKTKKGLNPRKEKEFSPVGITIKRFYLMWFYGFEYCIEHPEFIKLENAEFGFRCNHSDIYVKMRKDYSKEIWEIVTTKTLEEIKIEFLRKFIEVVNATDEYHGLKLVYEESSKTEIESIRNFQKIVTSLLNEANEKLCFIEKNTTPIAEIAKTTAEIKETVSNKKPLLTLKEQWIDKLVKAGWIVEVLENKGFYRLCKNPQTRIEEVLNTTEWLNNLYEWQFILNRNNRPYTKNSLKITINNLNPIK